MIIANFINKQDALATGLDQYDYGQVLRIQGLNLPTAVEIHFGLEETGGTTTTRIGVTKDGVTDVVIPDSMLENGDTSLDYTIYAFVYLTDDTSGKTVHRIKMQVKARSKPEQFDKPSDTELFHKVIKVVNDSAERAEKSANTAEENALKTNNDSVKTGEDRIAVEKLVSDAKITEGQVIKYAGQAQSASEKALLSEQEAKKSEEASLQHRTGAEVAENNAELAEQNAKKSEQAAEQAKQLVMQMGQEVLQNKNHVDRKVEAFNKVVADAIDTVETAKTDAVGAVGTTGTEQTKKVSDEGAKQVVAVKTEAEKHLKTMEETVSGIVEDRQQIGQNKEDVIQLKKDLYTFTEPTGNLFYEDNIVTGGYFSNSGDIYNYENAQYSPVYIPVKSGATYSYTHLESKDDASLYYYTYDSEKNPIERLFSPYSSTRITIKSGVAFIRLSTYKTLFPKEFMFNEGDTVKPYRKNKLTVPYKNVTGFKLNSDDIIDVIEKTEVFGYTDKILTPHSKYEDVYPNKYANDDGLHDSKDYKSFGFLIDKPTVCYFTERSNFYTSIVVFTDKTMKRGVRYRFLVDGEDTLPYEGNPIVLKQGDYIVFTASPNNNMQYNAVFKNYTKKYNGSIPLDDKHIDQVLSNIGNKKYVKYIKESGLIDETVYIFIPTTKGYLRYDFIHYINNQINANVWKVNLLYACDEHFNVKSAITAKGEWECAIRMSGRPDFSGGSAHGDERFTDIKFFLNSKLVDITTLTELTEFETFKVVQTSNLYDPNDSKTIFAVHGSEHIFDSILEINQSLKWLVESTVVAGHMAMLLMSKDSVDKLYTDSNYEIVDLSNKSSYQIFQDHVNKVSQYSEKTGIFGSLETNKECRLICGDNGGGVYHKCYLPYLEDTMGSNVPANTLWKIHNRYYFEVGK